MARDTRAGNTALGLLCLGATEAKPTSTARVFDIREGRAAGRYYVGHLGGLRRGRTKAESVSLTDSRFHQEVMNLGAAKAAKTGAGT